MNSQFYVTLPSNTEQGNTASNFRVKLPHRLKLDGEWEVALSEIIYVHSWIMLHEDNKIYYETFFTTGLISLRTGYYENIDDFLKMINEMIQEEATSNNCPELATVLLEYDKKQLKVNIYATTKGFIKADFLGDDIKLLLGFNESFSILKSDDGNVHTEPHLQSDLAPPTPYNFIYETMYVYCSIIENQFVGNTLAPLLRIVDAEGKFGSTINKVYDSPHYVPVLIKDISFIEINIKDDMNNLFIFEFGKVLVKLHFRKRSYF